MKWLINHPKITLLFFIMLMMIGIISFSQMPQREIPDFSPPIGQVSTVYPGGSAEEVEEQVTDRIEDSISQYEEIEAFESVSAPGLSLITIELDESVSDTSIVWNDIQQEVNSLSSSFPEESGEPSFDTSVGDQGLATYYITYESDEQLEAIQQVLNNYNDQLRDLPDIVDMDVQGGLDKEVAVALDPEDMEDNDLSYDQIIGALNGEEDISPIGEWEDDDFIYPVDLDNYSSVSDFNTLPVDVDDEGELLRLDDVGTMEETFQEREEAVTYDGEQSLSLTFTLQSGSSVPAAQDQLDEFVERLNGDLPATAEIELLYTQADLVSELLGDLAISFAIAVMAVLMVCSLGLRPWSATSVAIAVPVSLGIGSVALPFFDVGLDQISLIGYIIVLAILVDDGIVVNDNIERQLRNGKTPTEAAWKGTKEVFWSVVTSTIVVVFTFFPILFLPGGAGEFIRPLPVVLISAIIASTLVSLIIIPIYRMRKDKHRLDAPRQRPPGLFGPLIEKAGKGYSEKLMSKVVKRPFIVGLGGLLLGTSAFALIPWVPLEFFPDSDREEVFVEASLADGTPLEQTEAYSEELAQWLNEEPFVRSVSTYTGTGIPQLFETEGGSEESENLANFLVYIDKEMIDARDAMNQWSEQLPEAFAELEAFEVSIIESGPPVGAPIAIEISGDSITTLMEKNEEARDILGHTEGVTNVDDDVGTPVESYRIQPDREVMEENGLSSSEVSDALTVIGEGIPLGTFATGDDQRDWRLTYSGDEIDLLDQLTMTGMGEENIPLADIVTIEEETIQPRIPHNNGDRTITVRAFPGERSADDIIDETEDALMSLEESDVSVNIGGETEERTDVFIQIGQIFIVVVFLILIAMAIQFYSLSIPLIIMSSVYLAFSGAVVGLFITQTGLGFMSLMGGVSLAGIVIRNGIVLIEFIEQRRKEGLEAKEAVMLAAEQRFRPVVLTSLTTIAGLLPVALGNSTLFQPLGITIVSGALFSAILTLFVVPALYLIRDRWKTKQSGEKS